MNGVCYVCCQVWRLRYRGSGVKLWKAASDSGKVHRKRKCKPLTKRIRRRIRLHAKTAEACLASSDESEDDAIAKKKKRFGYLKWCCADKECAWFRFPVTWMRRNAISVYAIPFWFGVRTGGLVSCGKNLSRLWE